MNVAPAPMPVRDRLARFARLMEVANAFHRANPDNPAPPMDISLDDVQALFKNLAKHEVQFLLVGGMAGMLHGTRRTTDDLDLWIRADETNKDRLIAALIESDVVGAEYLRGVPLIFGWTSVRVGRSGFELDLGHSLKAFADTDFDTCYARARRASFDDVPFRVISIADLIVEKKAVNRDKDRSDVTELQRIVDSSQLEQT